MSRHPEVKWAQRPDVVFLTVLLPDAQTPKVNLDPEGIFTFSATAGVEGHPYDLKLELLDKVNVAESKINIGKRSIFCVLEKAEQKWWNKLLRGEGKAPHYVKVDWDKWVDEDDEGETGPTPGGDFDMNSMDFSKFGDMGGMGGLGGMGGMGGMGGLGGLGGMGGMGGMGLGDDAMGDDFDGSDDEEEEVAKPSEKADVKGEAEPKGEGKAEATPSS